MRFIIWPVWVLGAIFLFAADPAQSLYRCTAAGGQIAYQQMPCQSGDSVALEAHESFGVRPVAPHAPVLTPINGANSGAGTRVTDADHGPPVGHTATGKPIYAGPRGGRYTVSASGRKNYLPKDKDATASVPVAPTAAGHAGGKEIHVGAKGGCYTLGATGRKNYLPRDRCPQK